LSGDIKALESPDLRFDITNFLFNCSGESSIETAKYFAELSKLGFDVVFYLLTGPPKILLGPPI
jgi:hypothetical protein